MKISYTEDYAVVRYTTRDIQAFADQWPCFGPVHPIQVEFSRSNGDLVDIYPDCDENSAQGIFTLVDAAEEYIRDEGLIRE